MDGRALNKVHMSYVTLDAFKIQRTKYRHVCGFLFHLTSLFLNWVWTTYSLLLPRMELGSLLGCFPFSNLCTVKRQAQIYLPSKDQSDTKFRLDLLSLGTSIHLKHSPSTSLESWEAVITDCLALSENDSIWKAAGHTRLKSKCLAALEVLKLGKASIINKGALLAIVFKNISPCRFKNCVLREALVVFAPLQQEGTQLTQAGFVLISAGGSPPHHPLLSFQCSSVYKCP